MTPQEFIDSAPRINREFYISNMDENIEFQANTFADVFNYCNIDMFRDFIAAWFTVFNLKFIDKSGPIFIYWSVFLQDEYTLSFLLSLGIKPDPTMQIHGKGSLIMEALVRSIPPRVSGFCTPKEAEETKNDYIKWKHSGCKLRILEMLAETGINILNDDFGDPRLYLIYILFNFLEDEKERACIAIMKMGIEFEKCYYYILNDRPKDIIILENAWKCVTTKEI